MGPTWDLSAPDGLHVGRMNLAIRDSQYHMCFQICIGLPTCAILKRGDMKYKYKLYLLK